MHERSPELQRLIDATQEAILAGAPGLPSVRPVTSTIFSALESASPGTTPEPSRPAVCQHLEQALATARAAAPPVARLANAVAAIAPRLAWAPRPAGAGEEAAFRDNHANAVIVGAGGLEERPDVRIGMSLMAPQITYPDHRHPPEEVYVVLSPGAWRQDDRPWLERGPGELVHNPPGIWHAMRSGDEPLLALWCLWTA